MKVFVMLTNMNQYVFDDATEIDFLVSSGILRVKTSDSARTFNTSDLILLKEDDITMFDNFTMPTYEVTSLSGSMATLPGEKNDTGMMIEHPEKRWWEKLR